MPWTRTGRPTAFDSNGRVDPGVAGVVTPVGARARHPDPVHLVLRQAEHPGHAVAREMRLCEPVHSVAAVGAHVDDRAGRTHAGMRLERPLVVRLDDLAALREGGFDLRRRPRWHFGLDDGRLTDVVVDAAFSGKGGFTSDQVTLSRSAAWIASHSLGDDAEEPLVADDPDARNIVTEASSTAAGTAPATGGRIIRPCSMPGTLSR